MDFIVVLFAMEKPWASGKCESCTWLQPENNACISCSQLEQDLWSPCLFSGISTTFLPLGSFSRSLQSSVCDFSSCKIYIFFSRYSSHVQLKSSLCACGHMFMFICICVCWFGGMNPNEIFYGPVDLLIVPQVLSLLTPHLLKTTCWAWFFSFFLSSEPPPSFPSSWPLLIFIQHPQTQNTVEVMFHREIAGLQ